MDDRPTHYGDPFCETARAIEQNMRRYQSALVTMTFGTVAYVIPSVGVSVFVGAPTGPLAPAVGYAAGAATFAALTAGTYYVHEKIHDLIDKSQNRSPAVAPVDMTCKQYLSHAAMSNIKSMERMSDSGTFQYDGSNLQKILRANPKVLDQILATPLHSDPMNPNADKEEKHLRGFAVEHAPRPMTRSEQFWGAYAAPELRH